MGEVLIAAGYATPHNRSSTGAGSKSQKESRYTANVKSPLLKSLHTTPLHQNYYGDLAAKMVQEERLEDFLMIAETVLFSNSSVFTNLVSSGISTLISRGSFHSLAHVLTRIHNLGIVPSTLFNKSASNSLATECRRLLKARKLKQLVDFLETLAAFFSVEEFVPPSEIIKLCIQDSDPETAVRYVYLLPQAPSLFSSIILEFGKRRDLISAIRAYEASKSKSDAPNMYVCRTIIDVCGICGDYLTSRNIYTDLLAQNVIPNIYVFNSLMNVNARDLGYTLHIYQHMKNIGVTPDLTSYNVLLKSCCRAGRVDLAQEIYEEVRCIAEMGRLNLDVITYSTMIKVFADAKMWDMALKMKEDMLSGGVIPNVVTWSSLISACANAGLVEKAIQVFEEMLSAGCEPNAQCYNSLLYACVEACQYDRAFRIFQSWRASVFQGRRLHNGQVGICSEVSSENDTTKFPTSNSSHLSVAKVVPFTPTVATFNILMKACGTDYHRAKSLMDEMKIGGLSPNNRSWSILIDIYGSTGNVEGSVQALKAMRDNGIEPDVIAYTTAIKACVRNKHIKLAFSLFEEMKSYRLKPNLVTYTTLLRARRRYGSLHEVQQCLATYQDMRKAGYSPNDYFLKELIEEWCEGVITGANRNEGIVYRSDLRDRIDRGAPQNIFLEKVAAYLQRDVSKSMVLDLRGLTKVEARIIVLAVLRMIKENYSIGDTLEDDIIIILGARKDAADATNHKFEVQDAVAKLLQDELGLCVLFAGTMISVDRNDLDADLGKKNAFHINVKSSARRPIVLRRLKVTRKSLYQWLQKRAGTSRR